MLTKIFFGILLLSIFVMGALFFLSSSSLNSIGFSPRQIVDNFFGYNSIYWTGLWVTSGLLLIFSNVLLWTNRNAWSLWISFVFFAVFLMLQTMFIGDKLYAFTSANLPAETPLGFGGIAGAFACVVVAIGVFFNQFLVLRMRDKMFKVEAEPKVIETIETET